QRRIHAADAAPHLVPAGAGTLAAGDGGGDGRARGLGRPDGVRGRRRARGRLVPRLRLEPAGLGHADRGAGLPMIALTLLTPGVLAHLLAWAPTRRFASAAVPVAAAPAFVLAFTGAAPLRLD